MKKTYSLVFSSSNLSLLQKVKKKMKKLNITHSWVSLPKKKKRFTLLRSPHVNSKSKEHFEIITYKRLARFDGKYNDLETLVLSLPTTVKIKITVAGNIAAW